MKDSLKKYIEDHREEFDTLDVPEESFDKIMSGLNEKQASDDKVKPLFTAKKWLAAASVIILVFTGIFIFRNQKNEKPKIIAQIKMKRNNEPGKIKNYQLNGNKPVKTQSQKEEIESKNIAENKLKRSGTLQKKDHFNNDFSSDKTQLEKEKAIELLNNSYSASLRLEGIALIKNQPRYDQKIINLLSGKALKDENINVRLAAVEALQKHAENPNIDREMQKIFLQQDDPMVQKELIAILGQKEPSKRGNSVNARLKELITDPITLDFVKNEAYAVLLQY